MSESALFTGMLGALFGYLGAAFKARVELASHVDQQLRDARADAYKLIWERTGLLPEWPRNEQASIGDLATLRGQLRDWYFAGSGMFLSETSRKQYGRVQEVLSTTIEGQSEAELLGPKYDGVRKECSRLRTALAGDLLSRRGASLWGF